MFFDFVLNFGFLLFRSAKIAQVLIGLAVYFTFALQFYVPCDIIWRKLEIRIQKENHNVSQILLRTGLILIMGGIAAAVPELDAFITLVGAVFFSLLGKFFYICFFLFGNQFSNFLLFFCHLN